MNDMLAIALIIIIALLIAVPSFGFSRKYKLHFRPADKIMDLYRATYPIKGFSDALKLETLAKKMKKRYGIVINQDTDTNITLGEIFEMRTGSQHLTAQGATQQRP